VSIYLIEKKAAGQQQDQVKGKTREVIRTFFMKAALYSPLPADKFYMATTIRIENKNVTISSDFRPFRGRVWEGTIEEAISNWVGKRFTRLDSRCIVRRDFLNARGTFKQGIRQTVIE
jgi:hypothetical protein